MSRLLYALVLMAAVASAGTSRSQTATPPNASAPPATAGTDATPPIFRGIGRAATAREIAGWDIDVRPDGQGLPSGKGSVKEGEAVFLQRCAGCHGEFGEGTGRWPVLAAGTGTLIGDRPVKTIGSYWPYASTLFDYVTRAQPFGDAQSMSSDERYAVVAYLLFLNDIINDTFVLSRETLPTIKMPNQGGFHDDDRETVERALWNPHPCMRDCKAEVKIIDRARALDVTPAGRSAQPRAE
ncbi:MAG: cytochrome c [Proteobacteria bacterium]|nr:cytochrome c [Pseudomonadota bacterium]